MAMNIVHVVKSSILTKGAAWVVLSRSFAAGGKAKKGGKGGGSSDTPKSTLTKEVKASTVVGANILKDGTDPKVLGDSEYPDWLWHLVDKRLPLSELQRKEAEAESLSIDDLKRYVKLDNRARIKENNSVFFFFFFSFCSHESMYYVWLLNKQICCWFSQKSRGFVNCVALPHLRPSASL